MSTGDYSPDPSNIKEIKKNLNVLYKTVYQGNGTPSLVNQVSKLEHRIDTLDEKLQASFKAIDTEMALKFQNVTDVVTERFNLISYQITQEFEKRKTDSAGRWSFKTSTLTAMIAGFCSIVSVFVTRLFGQ